MNDLILRDAIPAGRGLQDQPTAGAGGDAAARLVFYAVGSGSVHFRPPDYQFVNRFDDFILGGRRTPGEQLMRG